MTPSPVGSSAFAQTGNLILPSPKGHNHILRNQSKYHVHTPYSLQLLSVYSDALASQGSEPSISYFDGGLNDRDRLDSSGDGVTWGTVNYLHLLV